MRTMTYKSLAVAGFVAILRYCEAFYVIEPRGNLMVSPSHSIMGRGHAFPGR